MRVYHQCQAIELAHSVNAAGPNILIAIAREPNVEVAATALGPCGTEINVGRPQGLCEELIRPERPSLISWCDRREDELVG
jgi:hypothetical protein